MCVDVFLAEPHDLVRHALRQVLTTRSDLRVVGEASSLASAADVVREVRPHVLVADPSPEGPAALAHLGRLRRELPPLRILVLAPRLDLDFAVRCFEAGACGYLTKDCPAAVFLTAVRAVALGQRYVAPDLAEALGDRLARGPLPSPGPRDLSARERQVLALLARGRSVSGIARELGLGLSTVGTYRSRALGKLELQNSAQLVRWAFAHGLTPTAPEAAGPPAEHPPPPPSTPSKEG